MLSGEYWFVSSREQNKILDYFSSFNRKYLKLMKIDISVLCI